MRVHPLAPVVGLDIDGTFGDYFAHMKWFAELYLQRPLTVDWSSTDEFSEALGLDKHVYRDIKLAFRQGGMKRCMPLINPTESRQLIPALRKAGIQVWICTTRPWNRLDNIDPDTQFWLSRNFGKVDGVIYGDDKYEDLIDIVGQDRILGVIDDLPENISRALQLNLNTAIRAGDHNLRWREQSGWDGVTISNNSFMWPTIGRWKLDKERQA
mgnify:CR=1 FL=1